VLDPCLSYRPLPPFDRLAGEPQLLAKVHAAWQQLQQRQVLLGSTGSRLLSGNSELAEELEAFLAKFHGAPAALLFNSGYDANVGFFSSVPQRDDLVLYDELIHASVHDGMRLGRAPRKAFRHNDLAHLRSELSSSKPASIAGASVFVAVETVYSMDGDCAPLLELVQLCEEFGANLVVDEAHATGVIGATGEGCVKHLGLQERVFARLHTFGKGVGCHGAAVLGSVALQQYLINYARSLIYSTSLPPHSLLSIRVAYEFMAQSSDRRAHLARLVALFRSRLVGTLASTRRASILPSDSAIQGVIVPGNDSVVLLAAVLSNAGFDVKPIRSPTVPAGTERVRICLHAHNTLDQVDRLCTHIVAHFRGPLLIQKL